MSNGFVHSVKVPRIYKITAKTIQNVAENGASLKQLIYEKKHPNIAGTYALAVTTLRYASQLDELLRKSQILVKEKPLDPWLARVLIAELLWGKKTLKSEAKPMRTVLSYEKVLRDLLKKLDEPTPKNSEQVKKPRYVRVNTLVTSVEDTIRSFTDEEWILLPKSPDYSSFLIALSRLKGSWFVQDFHIPELLAFPCGTQFHNDPRYKTEAIVLQDKASCFPAFLLKPKPGSTVLDMCAAPGMKTTHLAAIMQNKGKIFAIEKNKRRYQILCKLVEENNANCVTTLNADSITIDAKKCPNVEYILVDPSCSGSGMFDRLITESTSSKCAPGRLRSLQSFQVFLLRHALFSFPMVKRVVYSTCSIFPEENEMVIDEVLADLADSYKLKSVKKILGGNWKNFSSNDYACKKKCLYARPEMDYSNGFFVAVFERNFDVPLPKFTRGKAASVKLVNIENSNLAKETNFEENDEQHSVKNQRGKKKSNDKTTNATSPDETMRKKKRKRTESESVKTVLTINGDESLVEMKSDESKKKKKKKNNNNKQFGFEISEINEAAENCENVPVESPRVKKEAKKKKKQADVDVSVEIIDDNDKTVKTKTSPFVDRNIKKKKRAISIVYDEVVLR